MNDETYEPNPRARPEPASCGPHEEFDVALTEVNGDPFLGSEGLSADWRVGE